MRISRTEAVLNYAILTAFSVFAVVPLIGVVLSALTPVAQSDAGFRIPSRLAFGNFAEAWQRGHFSSYMASSILVTSAVVALTIVLSALAGFAFARLSFPGSQVLFLLMLAGLLLPAEAFIIPLYYDLRGAGLTDTYWALILPQTAQSLGFGIFWMTNHFRTFPGSVIEAARLDGAGDWRVLWSIIVPPSRPAILTMALLVGMWTWNEFLIPLVMISGEAMRTAPLGLAFFQSEHTTEFALLAAAGTIVATPIVVLYLFLQRRFISGILSGVSTR